MYDNGLLKYYREKAYKDGVLICEDIPGLKHRGGLGRISIFDVDGHKFYTKVSSYSCGSPKRMQDAEVLISQIYNKAGIKSAIYLPASMFSSSDMVISNDIQSSSVILAEDFLDKVNKESFYYLPNFLFPGIEDVDMSKHFTTHALQQQTKLRIYDIASYNTDRHQGNFFYELEQETQTLDSGNRQTAQSNMSNRADDIVVIDSEQSGLISHSILDSMGDSQDEGSIATFYYNDFYNGRLDRDAILKQLRDNEHLADLLNKSELAEEMGAISPKSVAQDIKDTIGYEVEPKYVDFLEKSYDEVAETLIK